MRLEAEEKSRLEVEADVDVTEEKDERIADLEEVSDVKKKKKNKNKKKQA